MKTLAIIFGLLSFFNSTIAYLPPKFSKTKQRFNTWFLNKCIALQPLNNDQLIKEVKPLMYAAGIFLFFLSIAVAHLKGPDHAEPIQIIHAWAGTFFFTTFGLVTFYEFVERTQKIMMDLVRFLFWVAVIIVAITVFVVTAITMYHAALTNQPVDPDVISQLSFMTLEQMAWKFGVVFALLIVIVLLFLFIIPFLTGRTFLWFVRKMANFIINKEQKDPIKIPLLILSGFFLSIAIYSYFVN